MTYDVFAVSEIPQDVYAYADARDSRVRVAFILPSERADACVFVPDLTRPSPSAVLCAAMFMRGVRGLPLDEVEIESCGKIYRIKYDHKSGKYYILMPKCKLLSSNINIFVNEIPLSVSLVECRDGLVSVNKCDDVEHFSISSLRRIYTEMRPYMTLGAVAYSVRNGQVLSCGFFPVSDIDSAVHIAQCVCTAAGITAPPFTTHVSVDGILVTCEHIDGLLAVSSDYVAPLTLVAPDIF